MAFIISRYIFIFMFIFFELIFVRDCEFFEGRNLFVLVLFIVFVGFWVGFGLF